MNQTGKNNKIYDMRKTKHYIAKELHNSQKHRGAIIFQNLKNYKDLKNSSAESEETIVSLPSWRSSKTSLPSSFIIHTEQPYICTNLHKGQSIILLDTGIFSMSFSSSGYMDKLLKIITLTFTKLWLTKGIYSSCYNTKSVFPNKINMNILTIVHKVNDRS